MPFSRTVMKSSECYNCFKKIDQIYNEGKEQEIKTKKQLLKKNISLLIPIPGIIEKILSFIDFGYSSYNDLDNEQQQDIFDKEIGCTKIGRLYGVYHCTNCRNNCKEEIIDYINIYGKVPLYSFLKEKHYIELKFFRKSKDKIYVGNISHCEEQYLFGTRKKDVKPNVDSKVKDKNISENKYFIKLGFEDNKEYFSRYVSLENIFFHNPLFYEKLISSKNLFEDDKIKISFNELSKEIKDDFKQLNDNNKGKKSSDFTY